MHQLSVETPGERHLNQPRYHCVISQQTTKVQQITEKDIGRLGIDDTYLLDVDKAIAQLKVISTQHGIF